MKKMVVFDIPDDVTILPHGQTLEYTARDKCGVMKVKRPVIINDYDGFEIDTTKEVSEPIDKETERYIINLAKQQHCDHNGDMVRFNDRLYFVHIQYGFVHAL